MQTRTLAGTAMLAGVLAGTARANEIIAQNDTFVSGGPAVVVGDFTIGEQAGVRLTAPCQGNIVAVQIGWFSGTPGQLPSLEAAFHIYEGTTFPNPGPVLATGVGPVLESGFLNEFRYLDDTKSFPIQIPVAAGEQFYVAIEFANPTDVANGGPSVFRDIDGCQAGKNVLFAFPGVWLDFCTFLAGDLVIRAVVDCAAAACEWDCGDGDGVVGIVDFLTVLALWGTVGTDCDLDGGGVGITDLLEVLGHWGPCPT